MDPGILYAVITIIFGLLIAGIAYTVIRWLQKKAEETESQLDDILLAAIGKPLVITIVAGSIYIALTHFGILPETIAGFAVDLYVNAFFILIGAWIVSSFSYNLLRTYGSSIAEKTDTDFDDRLISLLEIITKYVIWFVAFLLILANFQYQYYAAPRRGRDRRDCPCPCRPGCPREFFFRCNYCYGQAVQDRGPCQG